MLENFANSLVTVFYTYAVLGLLFAITFLTIGIARIDHEAKASGLGFRLIITPGVVALWPLLAYRWFTGITEPPLQKDPHR